MGFPRAPLPPRHPQQLQTKLANTRHRRDSGGDPAARRRGGGPGRHTDAPGQGNTSLRETPATARRSKAKNKTIKRPFPQAQENMASLERKKFFRRKNDTSGYCSHSKKRKKCFLRETGAEGQMQQPGGRAAANGHRATGRRVTPEGTFEDGDWTLARGITDFPGEDTGVERRQ